MQEEQDKFKLKPAQNFCVDCGKEISQNAKKCVDCCNLSKRRVQRPSKKELEKEIQEKSFCQLGREYGVSSNTIRNWCKSYGIPYKKSMIKSLNTFCAESGATSSEPTINVEALGL